MAPYDPLFKAPLHPPVPGPFVPRPVGFLPPGSFASPGGLPAHPPGGRLCFHPGQPFANGSTLAKRFELTKMLQEGRCGFVYEARDAERDSAKRVLKTFDPRRGDAKDEELFRREAILLAKLDHPRIPKGFGLYDHQGMLCASQAFVEGQDLYHYVQEHGPLAEAFAIEVTRQVLDVLRHLHLQAPPVLHRDLKPENLLLDSKGRIWVIDFGASSDATRDKHQSDLSQITAMQTLGYASPEQVYGLEAYPASDLYALAASVLYLVTGRNPVLLYSGMTGRFEYEAPLTPGFEQLLADMLVIPVNERIQTAEQALERLDGLPRPDAIDPRFAL